MRARLLPVLLVLCGAALAEDELCFSDGTFIDGKVVSTTADSITFQKDGGTAMTVAASKLDPRCF